MLAPATSSHTIVDKVALSTGKPLSHKKTFYQWMEQYEPMVRHMINGFEAIPALQDELFQEVALNVWKALPHFKAKSSVKTFIARIAQNVLASHVAKAVRTIKASNIDDQPIEQEDQATPYHSLDKARRQLRLSMAIRQLDFEQQQVITLALEGMSYAEMAEILAISSNLVGVRLNRAKQALSKSLEV